VKYETYIVVALWVAAPASLLYAFLYFFRPWYSTPQGQALMLKSVGTAILLGMGLAATMWPHYPFRDEVRVLAFTLWAVGIVYLLGTLLFSPGSRRYPPWSWLRKLKRR
jgi:membrane-bound metal-dependent hydrolase YbcI (DUF457 family)